MNTCSPCFMIHCVNFRERERYACAIQYASAKKNDVKWYIVHPYIRNFLKENQMYNLLKKMSSIINVCIYMYFLHA